MADQFSSDEITPHLSLPYLMPDQAQKHVTLNEATRRLDTLLHLSVVSRAATAPPDMPQNGVRYFLPENDALTGAWAEQNGKLAIYEDTGWVFVRPRQGWRLWDEETAALFVYHQNKWQAVGSETELIDALAGVSIRRHRTRFDFAGSVEQLILPSHNLVLGVVGVVEQKLIGVSGWQVGLAGQTNKFAGGLGTAIGTRLIGPTNPPFVVWEDTPLLLTPLGGRFNGGVVLIDAFTLTLPEPSMD